MGETVTLVLPAIEVPDHITDTPAGAVRDSGTWIPENMPPLTRSCLVNC